MDYSANASPQRPSGPSISHPYPPSYRSQLSSNPDQQQQQDHQYGYQTRRQERHQQHHQQSSSSSYPPNLDNPYDVSSSSDMHDARSGPGGIGYDMGHGDRTHRPTRLERSASESSTHPALPLNDTGLNPNGSNGSQLSELGGKEGRPDNWTKEDEDAEREFLSKGLVNWNELKTWRFWFRKEWWYWYIIIVVAAVLVALMTIFHDDIVKWMQPFANWMKDLPGGWAIPIGIFFVLSFPPLFGQEILAVLVGAVWGLWAGFGITAAGTFLGEVGNFYAFKYCLRSTAEKYEKNNLNYACMAHIVREGGFWLIFAIRLSAIPGHFSTAVFATCGMGIWIFAIATILTLPKQLIVVYLGVHFNEQDQQTKTEKIISYAVVVVGFLITIWAAWYIWREMHRARVHVWRKRRIEAASRGIVLNPVNGFNGDSTTEDKEAWDSNAGLDVPSSRLGHGTDVDRTRAPEGDDEALSPILVHRHHSFQNPYDIRYQSQDDMSVYHVDALGGRTQDLGPRVQEQDIGYGYRPPGSTDTLAVAPNLTPSHTPSPPPHPVQRDVASGRHLHPQSQSRSHGYSDSNGAAQFPEARSTGTDRSAMGGLGREPTSATMYSTFSGTGVDAGSAQFPVPLPTSNGQAYGHVDHGRDHPHHTFARDSDPGYGSAR
ncbi:hypothetical protein I317_02674 [Kwoniella heveanensis CBS 569]|nr:hypothetical protein I317_02674 [Kwoniella heveanensis CBS 569]